MIATRTQSVDGGSGTAKVCSISDCDRPFLARTYCRKHYGRWWKYGDPLGGVRKFYGPEDRCSLPTCNEQAASFDLCKRHRARQLRGVELDIPAKGSFEYQANHPIGQASAHIRVAKLWGSATNHPCIECGDAAHEWAYDGTDPTQMYAKTRVDAETWIFYSRWPEFYMPMCRKCHRTLDKGRAAQELRDYRLWRHTTGLTLADVTPLEYLEAV